MSLYYLPPGRAVTVEEWEADYLARRGTVHRVASTTLHTGDQMIRVSTVFLSIDHNWMGGPPLLWETMVFNGPTDNHCHRYWSPESATTGHVEITAAVKSALIDAGTPALVVVTWQARWWAP